MTIPEMRAYIQDVYPGDKWKAKVAKMPGPQVIAVYLTFRERIKRSERTKLKAIELGEALTQGFARGISEDNHEQISFDSYLENKSLMEEYLR